MKILQVITSLEVGGAEKLIVDIVPRLIEKGHIVDVVLFNGSTTKFTKEIERHPCKIYKFSKNGSVYNPLHIIKLIKIMRKYDIVHTHNTSPQIFVAIANILCKKKIITTEHSTTNRRRNIKWFKPIDFWMYSQYKSIISISDKATEKLKLYLPKLKTKIVTIYNGVDINKFHNSKEDTKLSKNKKKFTAVMVAGLRPEKDQDTLIKAMNLLPKEKYELWIIGDGERRNYLENLVKELELTNNIYFLGIRTNIAEILHTADVIIMSSHYEGLSLSSIEGMAVNKPFIASDVDGLREITKDAGILFEHGNAQQLADIIIKLCEDKKYYQLIADRCYKRAQLYDIAQMINSYEKLYYSII